MTAALRRIVCRVLVVAFVFAQLATAAHACVNAVSEVATAVGLDAGSPLVFSPGLAAGMGQCGMAGCESPGVASSVVCDAHCQSEQSRVDMPQTVTVPATLVSSSYPLPTVHQALAAQSWTTGFAHQAGSADPPHAILHCCFRL
jgi:hypothetical protein